MDDLPPDSPAAAPEPEAAPAPHTPDRPLLDPHLPSTDETPPSDKRERRRKLRKRLPKSRSPPAQWDAQQWQQWQQWQWQHWQQWQQDHWRQYWEQHQRAQYPAQTPPVPWPQFQQPPASLPADRASLVSEEGAPQHAGTSPAPAMGVPPHSLAPPPPPPQVSAGVGKPPHGLGVCIWMHLVNGTGNSPSPGRPTPGVVKQNKSSAGSVDTTKTRWGPQRVRMSSGERPIGAAKGTQSDTEALCQPPPPLRNPPSASALLQNDTRFRRIPPPLWHKR